MRLQLEQILPVKRHLSAGHFVTRTAAQHIGQRRLARTIGAHDRMDFTRRHLKAEAIQDLLAVDFGVEVVNFQHCPFRLRRLCRLEVAFLGRSPIHLFAQAG